LPLDDDDEKMRQDTLNMFSMNWEAVSHFLNRFFFWHGMLGNDAQVSCHNSAEAFVIWLMGKPLPNHVDPRYLEQLETLMGDIQPIDKRMSGASESPHDKPRKRKVRADV
jgi:hypothetical protein